MLDLDVKVGFQIQLVHGSIRGILNLRLKSNAQNARVQTSEIKCIIMITLFEAVIFTQ
jgi:hypothetical protein